MKFTFLLFTLFPFFCFSQSKKSATYNNAIVSYNLIKKAYDFALREDYKTALVYCSKAISVDSKNYQAYYLTAFYSMSISEYNADSVLFACNMAIKINPKYADAYELRAGFETNTPTLALDDYTLAIKYCDNKSNMSNYYSNRAETRTMVLDWIGALGDYNKSILYNDKNSFAYLGRAEVEINNKDYNSAKIDCDKAITLDPARDCNMYYYRGIAEVNLGQKDTACDDFYEAKHLFVNSDIITAINKYCK